jgi:hypothetical protein
VRSADERPGPAPTAPAPAVESVDGVAASATLSGSKGPRAAAPVPRGAVSKRPAHGADEAAGRGEAEGGAPRSLPGKAAPEGNGVVVLSGPARGGAKDGGAHGRKDKTGEDLEARPLPRGRDASGSMTWLNERL